MRIGVDIMGSDHGPQVPVRGVVRAMRDLPAEVRLVLIGQQQAIVDCLRAEGADPDQFDIVPSRDDIAMDDNPTKAFQTKPESSISLGFQLLKTGKIDAFASTGNTGAMLVGSVVIIKPIPGVMRPCIPTLVPKDGGGVGILLDVGANAECKSEVLVQFGLLGALMAEHLYHMPDPGVGLLNIGEEEQKGDSLRKETHALMKAQGQYRFVGNVEGRDLFTKKAGVMVCDGFTGNVVLKVIEGFHDLLEDHGVQDPFLQRFNYENYGGLPVLGVNGNVIIGHGISNEAAIRSMVLAARDLVDSRLNERIQEALK
jgi:glycerol-3-phosphate acyltransferase PlsX